MIRGIFLGFFDEIIVDRILDRGKKWRRLRWVVAGLVLYGLILAYNPVPPTKRQLPLGGPIRSYKLEQWQPRLEELRRAFGRNKKIPERYELACLLALSHYPELANARVVFRINGQSIPYTSRPSFISMFLPKPLWVYFVTISENPDYPQATWLMKNMNLNAAVGAMGHELAHTSFYRRRNFYQMLGVGIDYAKRSYRRQFEHKTEFKALDHGLGWQLRDWAAETGASYFSAEFFEKMMQEKPEYGSFFSPEASRE